MNVLEKQLNNLDLKLKKLESLSDLSTVENDEILDIWNVAINGGEARHVYMKVKVLIDLLNTIHILRDRVSALEDKNLEPPKKTFKDKIKKFFKRG